MNRWLAVALAGSIIANALLLVWILWPGKDGARAPQESEPYGEITVRAPLEFAPFFHRVPLAAPFRAAPMDPPATTLALRGLHAVRLTSLAFTETTQGDDRQVREQIQSRLIAGGIAVRTAEGLPLLDVEWDSDDPNRLATVQIRLIEPVFVERSGMRLKNAGTWARVRRLVPHDQRVPVALALVDEFLDGCAYEKSR